LGLLAASLGLKLGSIGFVSLVFGLELGLIGFVLAFFNGGNIFIILCYGWVYVHFGFSEIGFVLHKTLCRCAGTHRQGAVACRFLSVTPVGECLGFGSHDKSSGLMVNRLIG